MTQYKVVPFISSIKEGESAESAASQLERMILIHATNGWELHQVANVNIEVRPGCLSVLFGAKSSIVIYNQVIFKQ